MHLRRPRAFAAAPLLLTLFVLADADAEIRLPAILDSHAVLQRDREIPIWGYADPGERVHVRLAGHEASGVADSDGHWSVMLPAMSAGGPHVLTIRGTNELRLDDILIGEVWLASGQSNMTLSLKAATGGPGEAARAHDPQLRLFQSPIRSLAHDPREGPSPSDWSPASPKSAARFSAVAYWFAKRLRKELDVPIGLIHRSRPRSRIDSWINDEGFAAIPELRALKEMRRDRDQSQIRLFREQVVGWIAETEGTLAAGQPLPPPPPAPLIADRDSSSLYRRFIQPLVPYAIRGILWYQGEDDVRRSEHYGLKMRGLIAGWRSVWQQGELPFYFVQIPPYAHRKSSLSNLREEQRKALTVANTGMVVITDVVDPDLVHPPDKRPVAERLALLALAKTYGREDLVYSGPTFVSMRIEGSRAILRFGDTGSGLATSDEQAPSDFELAGADGVFHPARARIRGNDLVVDSAGVAEPLSVRMGWSNSATPNLMNREGLPASPFRATNE